MKTTLTAGGFVLVTLWLGYASGYHRGMQNERQAWESTQQARDYSDESSAHARHLPRGFYTNPHHRPHFANAPGQAVVNTPDPRTYGQYERSSP